jgi:hypothetical protein
LPLARAAPTVARMVERVAVVPVLALCALLGTSCGALRAQTPALGDAKHVTVEIVAEAAGKQVPRIPEPKPGEPPCAAFAIEGRAIAWRVGGAKIDHANALALELQRLATEPKNLVDDPARPGEKTPLPLVIRAPAAAYWRDVAETVDRVIAAGFRDVWCDPSTAPFMPWWVAKGVGDPVRAAHTVVVPRVIYCEFEDRPPAGRPVVYVLQDGRVEIGGVTVFHPQKVDAGKSLREALERLARAGRDRDGSRRFGPAKLELVDTHLLIHADQWAPWGSVRTVAQVATEIRPAFWRLEYAAGEQDFEARLRRGDRFPDPAPDAARDKR